MAGNVSASNKQIDYMMSLFGMVRKDDGVHQIINSDASQKTLYAQNMKRLAEFCSSPELSDIDILQFFSGSAIPVLFEIINNDIVCEHLGATPVWLVLLRLFRIVHLFDVLPHPELHGETAGGR